MDILIAKTENEKLIYLTGIYSRQDLLTMRSIHKFTCPDCGNTLFLKVGDIKIPHFAHKSHSDCESFSEPESSLHLQGKLLLHQFFTNKQFPVELEKYLPAIRQRADLLVDGQTVIEFQCSPISANDVLRRSAAYTGMGLKPTWIFGIKEKPADSIQIIRLMEYQKEMLIQEDRSKHLLLLNPEAGQFNYYSNLFHISGNRWVGKVRGLPTAKQTFPFAAPKNMNRQDFERVCIIFAQAKSSFIRSQLFAKNRYQNPFWLLCYKLGLDVRNVPATIGVPIIGSECIAEHAVIWQLKANRAFRQGVSISELLSSDRITLNKGASVLQLEMVLKDYIGFLAEIEAENTVCDKQSELLYDIYCKSVRKLRK
ncbi:MAG TPA: competence protein CoiA family protein [Planococcus sp. (in: firmicutes)]|nr:competence protein CoiA family protein [Planococcus sp. (in: firmicutes)]